jgi:hypothetical protein
MRRKPLFLLSAIVLAASGYGSLAKDAPPTASARKDVVGIEITRFVKSPAHAKAVAATAMETFNKLWDCASSTARPADDVRVFPKYGPVTFNDAHVPISGVITERVSVSGCGRSKIENILTVSDTSKSQVIPGMPGTTIADPELVRDTLLNVYQGAKLKFSACEKIRFVDSEFDAFDGEPNPKAKVQRNGGRAWRETWTVNGCGSLLPMVVRFIPDETGTAIGVEAPKRE